MAVGLNGCPFVCVFDIMEGEKSMIIQVEEKLCLKTVFCVFRKKKLCLKTEFWKIVFVLKIKKKHVWLS